MNRAGEVLRNVGNKAVDGLANFAGLFAGLRFKTETDGTLRTIFTWRKPADFELKPGEQKVTKSGFTVLATEEGKVVVIDETKKRSSA